MKNNCKVHIPQKIEFLRDNFKILNSDGYMILDVGGRSSYYELLETIFKNGKLYILNINSNDIRGAENAIVGDANNLPFNEETWDIVISFDTIEHLINPDDFLTESFRILKWGGG